MPQYVVRKCEKPSEKWGVFIDGSSTLIFEFDTEGAARDGLKKLELSVRKLSKKPAVVIPTPIGINPRSRYHPDNISRCEVEEAKEQIQAAAANGTAKNINTAPVTSIPQTSKSVPPAPGCSLADLIKASWERMVEWIKSIGGKHIDLQRSEYTGPVVQLDDLHAVQHLGRGVFAIHQLDRLDKLPGLDDPKMEIQYRGGVGRVIGNLGQVVER
jgi:hypothetical protein